MKEMEGKEEKQRKKKAKVEEMKENTKLCKELFPQQIKHPEMGELIFMVRQGLLMNCSQEQIRTAGRWWLWIRTIFIENTMTKMMKEKMRLIALAASKTNQPIHFVTTRSPEWVHAQISNQGDRSLPRSRVAIKQFSEIIQASAEFLPTMGTVLLADVAIDNLRAILQVCPDLERVIEENFSRLEGLVEEASPQDIKIIRLSQLPHPSGKMIGDLINLDGGVDVEIEFSLWAEEKISIASKESLESHRKMFGWSEKQSREHNRNLAKTMALVGQAVKVMEPPAILVHNEAFISRGALNNLLLPQNDPLLVICLSSLLERKKN